MLQQPKKHLCLYLCIFIGLISIVLLSGGISSQTARSELLAPAYPLNITPDQMAFSGDVTTLENCANPTVCSWLEDMPTGSILLGVDPGSHQPADWSGASATADIFLTDIYSPTVLTLRLSWPDLAGKGLHSPDRNRTAQIMLDGQVLWSKRTTDPGPFGDYYAADRHPILTTIVVTQSITHTLSLSVPVHTAWDLGQIELIASPAPTQIRGIGYSPLRNCQYPGGELQPSAQDIEADLFRLFHTSNAIRTYLAGGNSPQIVEAANTIGLPVFAGAWLDYPQKGSLAQDDAEIQALIDLACMADLAGGIVGNEYFLRSTRTITDTNYLLQRIQEVRSGIQSTCGKQIPITTAEIDDLMFTWETGAPATITGINALYQPIIDEVDFIMVHAYPFWHGMPIDGAAAFTVARYQAMQTLIEQIYPGQGKWILIGETGWPSAGDQKIHPVAVPSQRNQEKYFLEFLTLAEQEGVAFMYFDAFDERWKIEEPGHVGQNWGYCFSDRSAKYSFHGVLLPAELLPPPPGPLSHRVYLPTISGNTDPNSLTENFYLYTEWMQEEDTFVPSGWMGDTENISLYECNRINPHNGEMAIQIRFSPTGPLGWGGVYWQHPAENWGTLEGGHDFSGASRLTFWARGEQGGEVVEFLVGGLGELSDPYHDTLRPARSTGLVVLTDDWQQYEISLAGADLTRVIGGFAWVANQAHNAEPIIFYLDDIIYEFE